MSVTNISVHKNLNQLQQSFVLCSPSRRMLSASQSDQLVEVSAWLSVLYQRNYFIFLQEFANKKQYCVELDVLMGTAILFTSLQLRLAEPYHVVRRKWPLYATLYSCCHLVSGRPGCVWLAEPYHVVPFESSATPKHGIWVHVASFFLHNTVTNMLCRLFDDRKYMDIYLYLRNTAILENKKTVCIFSYQRVNTCNFTFTPRKPFKLTNRRHLYWVCANIFLKFIKFQSHFKKNLAVVIYSGCE